MLDANDRGGRRNRRTGDEYLAGVKTMPEDEVTTSLKDWWEWAHQEDFAGGLELCDQEPYPSSEGNERCDLVVREVASGRATWSIEIKHIALVGDNGKNNDYGVTKMLSPYLKDRSLLHDVIRLRESGFGGAGAAVVYSFSYSAESVAEALRRHPSEHERIAELDRVRRGADLSGTYSIQPMVELSDLMLHTRGLVTELRQTAFRGAWKHPAGGDGIVAGWQVEMVDG